MDKKPSKILITATHNTPALAVWQELRARGYENFLWVGQKKSMIGDKNPGIDYVTAEKYNIPFQNIIAGKPRAGFSLISFLWWARIPIGFIHAFAILKQFKPDLIITFGSHVGLPIACAGKLLGIPILHHQQPIVTGRSDQAIQRLADVCCYSWKATEKHLPKQTKPKAIYTGNPIRQGILAPKNIDFGFTQPRPIIAILGGNQGAHAINQVAFRSLPEICQYYNVVHQVGQTTQFDDQQQAEILSAQLNTTRVRYLQKNYLFEEEMGALLNQCDLVISRSGANFSYEFAATGTYSILIPLPISVRDEQMINAQTLQSAGLGTVLEQSDLNFENLLSAIATAIKEKADRSQLKEIGRSLIRLDGAEHIVNEAEKLLTS